MIAGAAVLASAAYAIGTQQGGGGAVAASPSSSTRGQAAPPRGPFGMGLRGRHGGPPGPPGAGRPCRGPLGPGLGALARKLGVSTSALRAALRDLRPSGPPPDGGAEKELADALGVSQAKLRAAFDKVRAGHRPRPGRGPGAGLAQALAGALGLDVSDVRAALAKVRAAEEAEHAKMRDEFATKLAGKLGIPKQRVLDALASMPHPPGHGPGPW